MRKKPNSHPHAWIKDRVKGFRDSGKSLGGLAKALGWAQPRLSELMKGKGKKILPQDLRIMAAYVACLCTRECAQVIVYSPSGAARIDAVRTLVNGRADLAAKDRIIVGLDRLKRIVGDRNAIVHGAPLRAGKEGKLTAIIRDIKPKRETVVVETEARRLVGAHLDQLGAITGDLWAAIYQDQNSALSGWRDAEAGK